MRLILGGIALQAAIAVLISNTGLRPLGIIFFRLNPPQGETNNVGGYLKAIRLFCVAAALVAILTVVPAQAQEPASARGQSSPPTLLTELNEVSLTDSSPADLPQKQDPPRSTTTDGNSPLPDAPTPAAASTARTGPESA